VTELDEGKRAEVVDRVIKTIEAKFYDPKFNGVDIRSRFETAKPKIIRRSAPEEFETAVNGILKELKSSHVVFYHESKPRVSGRIAISATFTKGRTREGERWVFQDVHASGPAARAGIVPGDILLKLDDQEAVPPDAPSFPLGSMKVLTVLRPDGTTRRVQVEVPGAKSKKQPVVVPGSVVSGKKLENGIAWIKITMFPGMVGVEVARDISAAVRDLSCDRLIFDLRGNTAGGMGCLRVMSHLCTEKQGVGYSLTRKVAQNGCSKEQLPRFDRIPDTKAGLLPLIFRFATAARSVAVFTEGIGAQKHHGKTVLLVNEHSASASEMVAAFASENRLATLVGNKTPGRLTGANSFKVGYGYRVALPVVQYRTWKETVLEGSCPDRYHRTRVLVANRCRMSCKRGPWLSAMPRRPIFRDNA
jgi:C-terminal processing protease CtpA/Prc